MNNRQPLVSIILPTYNVAKYLKQCLDSIDAQTYQNYECIIIIDGATDGSFEIAEDYCATHDKFSVYWQENAGSGPARNNGLDHAKGELIMFVDPDDWCEDHYVADMVSEQQSGNYDFVSSRQITIYFDENDREIKKVVPSVERDSYDNPIDLRNQYLNLNEKKLVGSPHGKIYKKSLIEQNDVRFPDLRRSQDIVFNLRFFDTIKSMLVTDKVGYCYRINYKSRTLRLPQDYYKTAVFLYKEIKRYHNKWNVDTQKEGHRIQIFEGCLYPCMEAYVMRGESYQFMLDDNGVKDIIEDAEPRNIRFVILKWLLINRYYKASRVLIKVIVQLKSIMR